MPHAAVKCFCVCQSFPFHHEDFHHLLCTSWWVASSVSKSTQIENEQHPTQPQTWNRSAVGERTTLWGRAGRSLWWHISYLQIPSVFLNGSWAKELIDILENWVTSLTALQLCRLLRAACLHKASCGTYSTVMPWLSIQSCSRWMLFLGVHYSCSARPWELLCKWGEMGEMKTLRASSSGT